MFQLDCSSQFSPPITSRIQHLPWHRFPSQACCPLPSDHCGEPGGGAPTSAGPPKLCSMPAITRTCRFSEPEVPPTRLCPVRHPSVAIRKLLSLGDHPVPRSNASCLDHDFPFFRSKQDTFGSGNGQKLTFWFKLTFEVESPLLWVDCAPLPHPYSHQDRGFFTWSPLFCTSTSCIQGSPHPTLCICKPSHKSLSL